MSAKFREKLFSCQTPIPEVLPEVSLYADTWNNHILPGHPEVSDSKHIEATLTAPTLILESASTTGNYVFINQSITDQGKRPLRVAVRPVGATGEVASAYFSSNVGASAGTPIWPSKNAKKAK